MNETTVPETATPPAVVEATKVNKSKLVVTAFKSAPTKLATPANDIIDAVRTASGVEVTVSLVNNLRSKLKAMRAARGDKISKTKRRKKVAVAVAPTLPTVEEQEKLRIVKDAAVKVGGLTALKELIATLESLSALAKTLSELAA